MVRFKNRWLLVEFIFPDDQSASLDRANAKAGPGPTTELNRQQQQQSSAESLKRNRSDAFGDLEDDVMTELDGNSDPSDLPLDVYPPLSSAPHFLVPTQPTLLHPRTGQAAGASSSARPCSTRTETHGTRLNEKQIWQAIKENVIEMSGDSGWGKVGSSLGVKYYSPTTSLCILRVARDHYRLVWSALTFLSRIRTTTPTGPGTERVIARVVCCSGTVKKLQLQAIRYSRRVVAGYLAQGVKLHEAEAARQAEIDAWTLRKSMIEADLAKLQDETAAGGS